jgi:glutamyl-tRNA synthetase/nondiscriminating glutamyl-tRNA synthetase
LHVGNTRTALFNWLFVKNRGGVFVIRIEDTDLARSEARFEPLILEDLRWLGMDWQEGPDVGGLLGPYRQSDRIAIYKEKAQELVKSGRAFYCFCSEPELELQAERAKQAGIAWKYPGTCRSLSEEEVSSRLGLGQTAVIRLKVLPGNIEFRDMVHGVLQFASDVISDPILIRSNGLPTYNYAVVVDDALMKITHVIRGDDHLSNTPKQVLIYGAFGWPLPVFAHLSTILGADHTRLSKRHGSTSVQNFREMGILPEALANHLALLGWSPSEGQGEILPPETLVQNFDLQHVSKSAAVFDIDKLYWLNRNYMKVCSKDRLIDLAIPLLQKGGLLGIVDGWVRTWVGQLVEALLPGIDYLGELPDKARFVYNFDPSEALRCDEVRQVLSNPGAVSVVRAFSDEISLADRQVVRDWKEIIAAVKSRTGQKGKNLFHPVRVALTGFASGPELDKLLPILEEGSQLPLPIRVKNSRERVSEFLKAMEFG